MNRLMPLCLALSLACLPSAQAQLSESLQGAMKMLGQSPQTQQLLGQALDNSEIVAGLKEALAQGVDTAIRTLGTTDGFLADQLVRIGVPKEVELAEQTARKLGQGQVVDSFIESMNRAAEQAVPEAATILSDAIRDMSVEDAMGILNGPEDAATQYFRQASEESLRERFLPVVEQATSGNGVTAAYKTLVSQGGNLAGKLLNQFAPAPANSAEPAAEGAASGQSGGMGALGGLMSGLGGGSGNGDLQQALDLDRYVTNKALDGLFTYIAAEEERIRSDPLARSTDLLKKVFQ